MVDGILLLDKPEGKSTSYCVRRLGGIVRTKAGHAGTLDPMATGLVTALFGRATKLSPFLSNADKTYSGEITLGISTSTGDKEGQILDSRPVKITELSLREIAKSLIGELRLPVPHYSAIKIDGKPLYKYARQGISVSAPERLMRVDSFEIESFSLPRFRFYTAVSKGTYIRALAEYLGTLAGCGAHLSALRRESVGALRVKDAVSYETAIALSESGALGEACIEPAMALTSLLPSIDIDEKTALDLASGRTPLIDIDKIAFGDIFIALHSAKLVAVLKKNTEGRFDFLRVFAEPRKIEN